MREKMKAGDLVKPIPGRMIDPGTKIGLCVYLHERDTGDDPADPFIHYTLLSDKGVIELPAWHWKLEVINASR